MILLRDCYQQWSYWWSFVEKRSCAEMKTEKRDENNSKIKQSSIRKLLSCQRSREGDSLSTKGSRGSSTPTASKEEKGNQADCHALTSRWFGSVIYWPATKGEILISISTSPSLVTTRCHMDLSLLLLDSLLYHHL